MHATQIRTTAPLHTALLERRAARRRAQQAPMRDSPGDWVSALQRAWLRAARLVERMRKAQKKGRHAKGMRNELAALDARALQDIGLHREEIGSIVAELTLQAPPTRIQTLRALVGPSRTLARR